MQCFNCGEGGISPEISGPLRRRNKNVSHVGCRAIEDLSVPMIEALLSKSDVKNVKGMRVERERCDHKARDHHQDKDLAVEDALHDFVRDVSDGRAMLCKRLAKSRLGGHCSLLCQFFCFIFQGCHVKCDHDLETKSHFGWGV